MVFFKDCIASRELVLQSSVVAAQLDPVVSINQDDHEIAPKISWSAKLARLRERILNALILPVNQHLSPSTRVCTHFREVVDVRVPAVLTKVRHYGVV